MREGVGRIPVWECRNGYVVQAIIAVKIYPHNRGFSTECWYATGRIVLGF